MQGDGQITMEVTSSSSERLYSRSVSHVRVIGCLQRRSLTTIALNSFNCTVWLKLILGRRGILGGTSSSSEKTIEESEDEMESCNDAGIFESFCCSRIQNSFSVVDVTTLDATTDGRNRASLSLY